VHGLAEVVHGASVEVRQRRCPQSGGSDPLTGVSAGKAASQTAGCTTASRGVATIGPSWSKSSIAAPFFTAAAQWGKYAKERSSSSGMSGVSLGETKSETWNTAPAAHEYGRAQTLKVSLAIAQAAANARQ
jgi:hypothetical protein